tara:strand:+ start:441 stop:2288 length:1848 start_codon:yes stop_codon:yes gene_type:complete
MSYLNRQASIRIDYIFFWVLLVIVVSLLMGASNVIVITAIQYVQPSVSPLKIAMAWSGVMLTGMFLASAIKHSSMAGGGHAIAEKMSAVEVFDEGLNINYRRLRNIVEEVAIARGAPVPRIYILNNEDAINGMAAGFTPLDAAIIVTRGALKYLNRDELQGLIAHEFSHIMNGDMRLNTKLIGYLASIEFFYEFGYMLTKQFPYEGGQYPAMLGVPFIVIGYLGIICSRLIKFAINRNRETLADVDAIRSTRLPDGLAGALKKIASLQSGSVMKNPAYESVCHLFFGEIHETSIFLRTHPNIKDRIKSIDPSFTVAELYTLRAKWRKQSPDGLKEDEANHINDIPLAALQAATSISAVNRQRARLIINSIPMTLQRAARDSSGVIPLIFALKYDHYGSVKIKQQAIIEKRYDKKIVVVSKRFYDEIGKVNLLIRLPLASLCLPSLRHIEHDQLENLSNTIHELDAVLREESVYQYCLSHLISETVFDLASNQPAKQHGSQQLKCVMKEVSVLMAVLAKAGSDYQGEAEQAYHAGMSTLYPKQVHHYEPITTYATALNEVWASLNDLDPNEKERLISGLAECIYADNEKSIEEIELLRTVCATLHCPLPLMVDALI